MHQNVLRDTLVGRAVVAVLLSRLYLIGRYEGKPFCQTPVQGVPATAGHDRSDDVATGKRDIANQIKRFVARTFVVEPQGVVDWAALIKDKQVLVGNVRSDTLGSQYFCLLLRHKRPRRCDLLAKTFRRAMKGKILSWDG